MTGLQKSLLSVAAIIVFGLYALLGKAYDVSRAASRVVANDATQTSNAETLSNTDLHTSVDQKPVAAQQQSAAQTATPQTPPRIRVNFDDDEGERETSD